MIKFLIIIALIFTTSIVNAGWFFDDDKIKNKETLLNDISGVWYVNFGRLSGAFTLNAITENKFYELNLGNGMMKRRVGFEITSVDMENESISVKTTPKNKNGITMGFEKSLTEDGGFVLKIIGMGKIPLFSTHLIRKLNSADI
jgi:hypothetical protein